MDIHNYNLNQGLENEQKNNEEILLNIRIDNRILFYNKWYSEVFAHIPLLVIGDNWLIIMNFSPNNDKLKICFNCFVRQCLDNSNALKKYGTTI